jgi:hypothetical protein
MKQQVERVAVIRHIGEKRPQGQQFESAPRRISLTNSVPQESTQILVFSLGATKRALAKLSLLRGASFLFIFRKQLISYKTSSSEVESAPKLFFLSKAREPPLVTMPVAFSLASFASGRSLYFAGSWLPRIHHPKDVEFDCIWEKFHEYVPLPDHSIEFLVIRRCIAESLFDVVYCI